MIIGVEYETKPVFCDVCGIGGHKASKCKSTVIRDSVPLTRGRSKVRSHRHASHQHSKKGMATLVPEVTQPVTDI